MGQRKKRAQAGPQKQPIRRYWDALLFLWLAGAFPELVLHIATATTAETTFNSGLVLPLLFALIPALLLFSFFLLIPGRNKGKHTITVLYSAIWALLCASQLVYYIIFKTFYSLYSMARGGQVVQFWRIILDAMAKCPHLLLLMALPALYILFFGKKHLSYPTAEKWPSFFVFLLLATALQAGTVAALPVFGGTGDMSAYDLYHNNSDSYLSVNRLGLATAFRLDAQHLLSGHQPSGSIHLPPPSFPRPPQRFRSPSPPWSPPQIPIPQETPAPTSWKSILTVWQRKQTIRSCGRSTSISPPVPPAEKTTKPAFSGEAIWCSSPPRPSAD